MRVWVQALALALLLAFAVSPGLAAAQQSAGLDKAYELEQQALREELSALQAEQQRARSSLEAQAASLREQITSSRARLTALSLEADHAEERLSSFRLQRDNGTSQQELFLATMDQAASTLGRYGVHVDNLGDMSDQEALGAVLASGGALLARLSSMRMEDGSFFLSNGEEVAGRLFLLGQVAAFGVSGEHGGALLPAGGDALRLDHDDLTSLRAWLAGEGDGALSLFLLDPGTRSQAAKGQVPWWQDMLSGGPLIWPILGLGLLALVLSGERVWTLRRLHSHTDTLLGQVVAFIRKGALQSATRACEAERGSASRVLLAGMSHWHLPKDQLEDVLKEAIVRETPGLHRFMPVLAVVAAVTPLLGLLGTVTGMISTFEVITEYGTGDPKMLSGGISVALVTTQLGLGVAIPVLLAHNLLTTLADHVGADMYKSALVLSNALYKQDSFELDDGRWVSRAYEIRDEPTGEIEFRREAPPSVTKKSSGSPPPPLGGSSSTPMNIPPWTYQHTRRNQGGKK